MVIQHNTMAMNAHRSLIGNNSMVQKNLEKLSSGYRINRAGDDAAGLAISEKMRAQIKNLEQSQRNAQDGVSLIQTAEGALTEVHSMLNRMVELVTQASNGTYTAEDLNSIKSETDSLVNEIDRIVGDTNFNGKKVLDLTTVKDLKIQVGDGTNAVIQLSDLSKVYVGADSYSAVDCSTLKLTGSAIFSGSNSSTTLNSSALGTVQNAIKAISDLRSKFGAYQNRLEHTINNLGTTTENLTASESRIRDSDMAKEMMAFTKNNVLSQAAQSMLAQSNQQPQQILQLLR